MKKEYNYSLICMASFLILIFFSLVIAYTKNTGLYNIVLIILLIISFLFFIVSGFLLLKDNSKNSSDEDIYHDFLFTIGIILIISGIILIISFKNNTQSLTLMITGVLISLIAKFKSKRISK